VLEKLSSDVATLLRWGNAKQHAIEETMVPITY